MLSASDQPQLVRKSREDYSLKRYEMIKSGRTSTLNSHNELIATFDNSTATLKATKAQNWADKPISAENATVTQECY